MRCAKLNRSSFIPKGGEPLFLLIMSGQTAPFVYINHFPPAILHSITCGGDLPRVIDLEHFIESFLARRSNQVPSRCPPVARLEKVFDFCRVLISIVDILMQTRLGLEVLKLE